MLNPQQIQQLINENELLQAQVKELEEILSLREEELEIVRSHAQEAAALRSQLDLRLDEISGMQNQLGQQQRKTAGAQSREMDLQQELVDSVQLLHQYTDLKKQYVYASTQLEDLQEELAAVKKKNNMFQKIAVQVGELESKVENLEFERDTLLEKLNALENIQP